MIKSPFQLQDLTKKKTAGENMNIIRFNWLLARYKYDREAVTELYEFYYPYKKNVYASPYTGIIETELHRAGDQYEVHFLLQNVDRTGKEKIWYLTIAGTNVEIES